MAWSQCMTTIPRGLLNVKLIEPPCTERYARWCERSANQLMISLLLDSFIPSSHYSSHPPNYTKSQSSHNLHGYMYATFSPANDFLAFQIFPFKIFDIISGNQKVSGTLSELCKVYDIIMSPFIISINGSL